MTNPMQSFDLGDLTDFNCGKLAFVSSVAGLILGVGFAGFEASTGNWLSVMAFACLSLLGVVTGFLALAADSKSENLQRQASTVGRRTLLPGAGEKALIAQMVHELRTPLNAIIGFSDAIRSEVYGSLGHEIYRDYVANIHQSGQHLLTMVNEVLDAAKLDSGRVDMDEEWISLDTLTDRALRTMSIGLEENQLELSRWSSHSDIEIFADQRLVMQMMLNLLSNAVKFTPKGGAVRLSARISPEGLLLSVMDTGMGIEEAQLPLILQPYGQADSAKKTDKKGTGLGIPLVKAWIEMHGGHMSIASQPGRGTTVSLYFPSYRVRRCAQPELDFSLGVAAA